MFYWGTKLNKETSILKCRNPFKKDLVNIDYDLYSEEEWEE